MTDYNIKITVDSPSPQLEESIRVLLNSYLSANHKGKFDVELKETTFLSIKTRDRPGCFVHILQQDIQYIERAYNLTHIVCRDCDYTVNASLSKIMAQLNNTRFFRCHQGYIVNLDEIREVYSRHLVLNNIEKSLPLSRGKKALINDRGYTS